MLNIPIAVQDALREGSLRKNYKMKVNDVDPDTGERTYSYTIENDDLVTESVRIDERMVTGKNLKFGLCEGSVLEFQYFNHPNINGKDVQVYLSAEYVDTDDEVKWYDIPMGWYSVDQCPMQWDTGIFKVTAYNKLKSKYLDSNVKQEALSLITTGTAFHSGELPVNMLLNDLLNGYGVFTNYVSEELTIGAIEDYAVTEIAPVFYVYPEDTSVQQLYLYRCYASLYIGLNSVSSDNIYSVILKNIDALKTYYHQRYATIFDDYYIDQARTKTVWDDADNVAPTGVWSILQGYSSYYNDRIEQIYDGIFDIDTDTASKLCTNVAWYSTPGLSYDYSFYIEMPILMKVSTNPSDPSPWTSAQIQAAYLEVAQEIEDIGFIEINRLDSEIGNLRMTTSDISSIESLTLRELQTAVYELDTQYGQLDRETDLFTGVELNQGGLYPADTLYPDNALYPSGPSLHPFPSSYQKLWTDTVGEQSFRYLIITYKAIENGEEVEKTLQRTVNTYGTTNYNMSDNWLFRNLVWTAEDVGAYADAMVLKMKDVRWFPFELWCAGLPYIETGDAIEITDRQGNTHTSYVLTRTLEGIHNLQDTFINGELDIF